MCKFNRKITPVLLLALFVPPAHAQESTLASKWYVGAGVTHNRLDEKYGNAGRDYDKATGYRVVVGYDLASAVLGLPEVNRVSFAAELGVANTGEFNVDGCDDCTTKAESILGDLVLNYALPDGFVAQVRLGIDVGDGLGLTASGGVQYQMTRRWAVRAEYVRHDDFDSLAGTLVLRY